MLLRMFVDVYMHAGTANNREKKIEENKSARIRKKK